jgi:hypothetical protein
MTRTCTAVRKRIQHARRLRACEILVRRVAPTSGPFRFDANLRISGIGKYHDEVELKTGIRASQLHRKGDVRFGTATFAEVCLGCLSESVYPYFTVDPASLDITKELNVGLAFNFTCV